MLALDLNDSCISVIGDDGYRYRQPGYALLEEKRLAIGDEAYRQARVRPRHIHSTYWSELGLEAFADPRFGHLSAADLASRQLEAVRDSIGNAAGAGESIVCAVPAYLDVNRLGLLLGICRELELPVAGLVDAAVAATRREYRGAVPVHIDVSLHSTLLSRLGQPGRAQVEKSVLVEGAGLVALHDAWTRCIAEAFVRQSRFDPLHTADTEQLLLERLPQWLAQATAGGTVTMTLDHGNLSHAAEVESLALVAAAAPVYQRIVGQLRALFHAEDVPALQLTDRAAQLPGLADMLKARVGGEAFLLEAGATGRGLLARCRNMTPGNGGVSLVRQLPWDQAAVSVELAEDTSAKDRPTHVLLGNRAYPLNGQPLYLGTQGTAGERWVELEAGMPGVSRRHCSLAIDNLQCVLRDHSRFGTFLNGHRLEGSAVLEAGDAVRIGTPGYELRLITAEQDHGP